MFNKQKATKLIKLYGAASSNASSYRNYSYVLNICNRRESSAIRKGLVRRLTISPDFSSSVTEYLIEAR